MSEPQSILVLAEKIEADIRDRKLEPGAGYHTTAETARMLGVNTVRANRALQLLANRGIIIRRQRRGAIVGSRVEGEGKEKIQRLHVVVHEPASRTEGLLDDGVLIGIQAELPTVDLRQHFLPGANDREIVGGVVADALRAKGSDAFVLYRASVAVQRILAQSGLPTVVCGGLHPSIAGVAAMDRDQQQLGRELASYMLRKRCSRFVCLMRDRPGPGDRDFARGVTEVLAAGKVPLDRLIWDWPPTDKDAVRAAATSYLSGSGKLGFICRNEFIASAAQSAVDNSEPGRSKPVIAMADCYRPPTEEAPFPFPKPEWTPIETGRKLAQLLSDQAEKDLAVRDVSRIDIPVRPIGSPARSSK